jgi:hypothetical protein
VQVRVKQLPQDYHRAGLEKERFAAKVRRLHVVVPSRKNPKLMWEIAGSGRFLVIFTAS